MKWTPVKGRIVGLKSDSHGRYINYLQFMMVPEKLYQKAIIQYNLLTEIEKAQTLKT